MYKLMAIDLDGTLLNSYGIVSKATQEALLEAKRRGTEVVLASGRPISSTESIAVELGVDNYLISGNGSAVYDIKHFEMHFIILFIVLQAFRLIHGMCLCAAFVESV